MKRETAKSRRCKKEITDDIKNSMNNQMSTAKPSRKASELFHTPPYHVNQKKKGE